MTDTPAERVTAAIDDAHDAYLDGIRKANDAPFDVFGAARRIAQLDAQKAAAEAEIKRLAAERATVEADLLAYAEEEGFDKITVSGRTVYLHSQFWAFPRLGDDDRAATIDAFQHSPYAYLVKEGISAQSLSAALRELVDAGDAIPDAIADAVTTETRYAIRSIAATERAKPNRRPTT